MGRKVHPIGFRVGIIRDWEAKWYTDKHYVKFLQEDLKIRQAIGSKYADAGISLVEINRQGDRVLVDIHTARPGVVIGRGGQRVDEMRQYLEGLTGDKIQLNIKEIRQIELDAHLVAKSVAEQLERRIAYRRAMKQALFRTIQAGAKGMRIYCAGRLGGAEIARCEVLHQGQVPLHRIRADIDYGTAEAHTTFGRIGVKVWIYKGDILPELQVAEVEEVVPMVEVAVSEKAELEPTAVAVSEKAVLAPAEEAVKPTEELVEKPVKKTIKKIETKSATPGELKEPDATT
ncbi:MAG: 30S ribosomal protein S3 [Dehalococcoidales bacterium]|nr:30S ribosomal protein S3 [Dehalococcoidales bacterium]